MLTRAKKSKSAPTEVKRLGRVIENSDIDHSKSSQTKEKDCSCLCRNHQETDDEWEIEKEELLHVEINGIFQVR